MIYIPESAMNGFVLPLVFSFSLIFGLLEITGLIKNRWAEVFIALSMAGFGVSNPQTVEMINEIMPIGLIGSIALFGIYLVYVIVYEKMAMGKNNEKTEGIIGVLILSLLVALQSPGFWRMLPVIRGMSKSDMLFAGAMIAIVFAFMWAYRLGFNESSS